MCSIDKWLTQSIIAFSNTLRRLRSLFSFFAQNENSNFNYNQFCNIYTTTTTKKTRTGNILAYIFKVMLILNVIRWLYILHWVKFSFTACSKFVVIVVVAVLVVVVVFIVYQTRFDYLYTTFVVCLLNWAAWQILVSLCALFITLCNVFNDIISQCFILSLGFLCFIRNRNIKWKDKNRYVSNDSAENIYVIAHLCIWTVSNANLKRTMTIDTRVYYVCVCVCAYNKRRNRIKDINSYRHTSIHIYITIIIVDENSFLSRLNSLRNILNMSQFFFCFVRSLLWFVWASKKNPKMV